jgi:lipid-A-disaccharide synthase
MLSHVKNSDPDAVILIDYPGFNLRFAKAVKKLNVPVIYFISPQIWAWGRKRVKKIKKFVDKMLVLFRFEVDFYKQYHFEAEYVGHPLVDIHHNQVCPKKTEGDNKAVLGLLPGSREQELRKLLPDMIKTAKILWEEGDIQHALIARVENIPLQVYQQYQKDKKYIKISNVDTSNFYNQIDAALVSSGTATLETAYFLVPMVIVYRVNILTWVLGKILVKIKYIGLANIVAEDHVADELLQSDFKPKVAAAKLKQILAPTENEKKRGKLRIVQKKLGKPGASNRAAKIIINFVKK